MEAFLLAEAAASAEVAVPARETTLSQKGRFLSFADRGDAFPLSGHIVAAFAE